VHKIGAHFSKNNLISLCIVSFASFMALGVNAQTYTYPFQNPATAIEDRITNVVFHCLPRQRKFHCFLSARLQSPDWDWALLLIIPKDCTVWALGKWRRNIYCHAILPGLRIRRNMGH